MKNLKSKLGCTGNQYWVLCCSYPTGNYTFKVNNKDTKNNAISQLCSSVSIVNFEQGNAGWVTVLKVLSREFRVGCPWEMLHADDLVILAETFERKMAVWKNGLESKGLDVNMGKTEVMISGRDLHSLQTSDKYPCAVCRKGVWKNS